MYNSNIPNADQLPSSKQLLLSTLAAAVVAGVLLITVVLPAEYAIDPTGIGKSLGLAQMGEIKTSLARESGAQEAKAQKPEIQKLEAQQSEVDKIPTSPVDKTTPVALVKTVSQPIQNVAQPVQNIAQTTAPAVVKPETAKPLLVNPAQRVIKLVPGAAAELKLAMKKGAKVNYNWIASGGKVNFDTHADNAYTNYYGYNKGRNVTGDNGQLTAAFDGSHGWFWRNRSGGDVTVTLEISGDYQAIKRVM